MGSTQGVRLFHPAAPLLRDVAHVSRKPPSVVTPGRQLAVAPGLGRVAPAPSL